MKYAIFAKNSWWRGVTQDDHVVFYIREAKDDATILNQLDPEKKYDLRIIDVDDDDYIAHTFGVDKIIDTPIF